MHVCFTLPEYQQEGITLSASGSPNFMEDERFWHRLAENKKHTTAGMEKTGYTCLFYPGNFRLQSYRFP